MDDDGDDAADLEMFGYQVGDEGHQEHEADNNEGIGLEKTDGDGQELAGEHAYRETAAQHGEELEGGFPPYKSDPGEVMGDDGDAAGGDKDETDGEGADGVDVDTKLDAAL